MNSSIAVPNFKVYKPEETLNYFVRIKPILLMWQSICLKIRAVGVALTAKKYCLFMFCFSAPELWTFERLGRLGQRGG